MKHTSSNKKLKIKSAGRRIRALMYLVFWAILLTAFTGLIVTQTKRRDRYKIELEQVLEELSSELEIKNSLTDRMAYFESDAYVEQLAREQLGFVKPDEIVFVNVAE